MKEPEFLRGMKNIRFTVAHRNSKELEDYVAYNYEAFTKLLKRWASAIGHLIESENSL